MIKKICIVQLFFLFISCSLNKKEANESWWKYNNGYYLGDVLILNEESLIRDTIYINNTPKAFLLEEKNAVLWFIDKKIIIKSIESDETGVYSFQK